MWDIILFWVCVFSIQGLTVFVIVVSVKRAQKKAIKRAAEACGDDEYGIMAG